MKIVDIAVKLYFTSWQPAGDQVSPGVAKWQQRDMFAKRIESERKEKDV